MKIRKNKERKNKRNKKAWLRVVEAAMAVLILIGFSVVMINRTTVKETNLQEKANELALKIEKNQDIREKIFEGSLVEGDDDIKSIVGDDNFAFSIDGEEFGDKPDKEIFAASIILTKIDAPPKKFTLFIWN